ncbi:MAG: hypothetical protein KatS3mg002_0091 [Candidatus Woesearchaeota archaeon]|nr:MAG: hypothetical protein KatS3mg002_0091 [Candidatus Woesearchaeota archaeon]
MNKYIQLKNGSIYSSPELLALLFNDFDEELNKLIQDKQIRYFGDIDMQNFTYNIYFIPKIEEYKDKNNINNIVSKIFISFYPKKTILGKEKYIATINVSINQNYFSKKIHKKIFSMIKSKVKKIKKIPEFKGLIKSIKI